MGGKEILELRDFFGMEMTCLSLVYPSRCTLLFRGRPVSVSMVEFNAQHHAVR